MQLTDYLGLTGGLALFLYGMYTMNNGLEAAAGASMKKILEKLTSNRFLGVLVGVGITAVIQSSSATTVMVVGFVNSRLMTLKQAVWVIMGANIGTTITGQLIALDVGLIAPIFAIIGVIMCVFIKKPVINHYGSIIAGLGILFIGMNLMSSSMEPLSSMPQFVDILTKFDNPLLGILAGAAFTAVIQSSSASVGILQALASASLITLPNAVYVLFGQNIGTCITAVIASVGTSRAAKRTTIIHLSFNIIGTFIFTLICLFSPFAEWVASLTPDNPAMQIANMHTIFNVATTLLLLPFGSLLAKFATLILKERPSEQNGEKRLMYLNSHSAVKEHAVGSLAIAENSVRLELERMAQMVKVNLTAAFDSFLSPDDDTESNAEKTEEYIDYLNKEISKYVSKRIANGSYGGASGESAAFFRISGNLERIGDHALNICQYGGLFRKNKLTASQNAVNEILNMKELSLSFFDSVLNLHPFDADAMKSAEDVEQHFDEITEEYRKNQLERLQSGVCSGEACILYSELLTDFERIGDHILNIAQALSPQKAKT